MKIENVNFVNFYSSQLTKNLLKHVITFSGVVSLNIYLLHRFYSSLSFALFYSFLFFFLFFNYLQRSFFFFFPLIDIKARTQTYTYESRLAGCCRVLGHFSWPPIEHNLFKKKKRNFFLSLLHKCKNLII